MNVNGGEKRKELWKIKSKREKQQNMVNAIQILYDRAPETKTSKKFFYFYSVFLLVCTLSLSVAPFSLQMAFMLIYLVQPMKQKGKIVQTVTIAEIELLHIYIMRVYICIHLYAECRRYRMCVRARISE